MEKTLLSNRILNALNTEVKNIDIIDILVDKNKSTKRDVLRLTGLRPKDYNKLVVEDTGHDFRGFLYDYMGTNVLSRHVKREDLTPLQKAVSRLLWESQKGSSMMYISQMYHFITDRFLQDDFWYEDVFAEETYEVTDEEFDEVAQMVLDYVKESQAA